MTTVFDISLAALRHVTDWVDGMATGGTAHSLSDTLLLTQPATFWNTGSLFIHSGEYAGQVLRIGTCEVVGTLEIVPVQDTAIYSAHSKTWLVTGALDPAATSTGAEVDYEFTTARGTVPIHIVLDVGSVPAEVLLAAALLLDDITDYYTLTGDTTHITATRKVIEADDELLNLSMTNYSTSTPGWTIDPVTMTAETAASYPARYTAFRGAYPFGQVTACINQALLETHVTQVNWDLIGDGEMLDFPLPAGVYNVKRVELVNSSTQEICPSTHWQEDGGLLRFPYGYQPYAAQRIYIYYRAPHTTVWNAEDVIDTEINREWLIFATARELLYWGAGQYGKNAEYLIEERLNKVLNALKNRRPRIGGPDVTIHTAGGQYGYTG